MAERPMKNGAPLYPRWATDLVKDDVNKEYNKYEPPEQKKGVGWSRGEAPPRQWVNYNSDLIARWIEYIDQEIEKLK